MRITYVLVAHVLLTTGGLMAAEYGHKEYAAECEKALGPLPTFDCLEGQLVPVTNGDKGIEITDRTHEGYSTKCDKPSLLRTNTINFFSRFNPCVPYMRVGRPEAPNGRDSQWVWTCRRYFVRSEKSPVFDDINMIGHSPSTGATCFFVSRINRTAPTKERDDGIDGTKIPAIGGDEGARFWKSPREMTDVSAFSGGSQRCVECHDNDPWIHSPFIRQVTVDGNPGSAPLVPSNPKGRYHVVGSQYFNTQKWRLRHLVSPEAEACTSCHRIGDQRSCADFSSMAVGLTALDHHTKAAAKTPWMPPQGRPWDLHPRGRAMDRESLDAVKFINDCCKSPDNAKCRWAPMPR